MLLRDQLRQLWDIFSNRQRAQAPGYKPDEVSERLRSRVMMLYADVVAGRMTAGTYSHPEDHSSEFWEQAHHALAVAYGRPVLSKARVRSATEDLLAFLEQSSSSELFDFVEAGFKVPIAWRLFAQENEFVDALNDVFRMEEAPYQLTPGVTRMESNPATSGPLSGGTVVVRVAFPRVVRVDDQVAHAEAVEPALSVLADPAYRGANDEFRRALDDYRRGDFEDCLGKCGSAFESVLKVLCHRKGIPCDPQRDTAGPLVDKVLARSTLDVATFKEPLIAIARMRNRLSSSHGGGATLRRVDRHVAQFALTATAAAIVLLVQDMGH
jgi:hypothetical protein